MIYLDTSAAAKLVHREAESPALIGYLAGRVAIPLVSSVLIYPELVRAVSRHRPELADRAIALTRRILTVPLSPDLVMAAATVETPDLRTLDALHLATAMMMGSELDALLTYDKRLAGAAESAGLPTAAPI
ncbi:MAG: type II toxin-antitoxin system VapC family toxin [Micromonosporaceae bacterium]